MGHSSVLCHLEDFVGTPRCEALPPGTDLQHTQQSPQILRRNPGSKEVIREGMRQGGLGLRRTLHQMMGEAIGSRGWIPGSGGGSREGALGGGH